MVKHYKLRIRFYLRNFSHGSPAKNRAQSEKKLTTKYETLLDLDKWVPNKEICAKYGIPGSTLSTWKKNKTKIFALIEHGAASTKNKTYENLNKASLKWFVRMSFLITDFF